MTMHLQDFFEDDTAAQGVEETLPAEVVHQAFHEAQEFKESVESEILRFLRARMSAFGETLGVYPREIIVTMVPHHFAGDFKARRFMPTNVTLKVEL